MIDIPVTNLKESLAALENALTTFEPKLSHKIMFISEEILTNIIRHGDFNTSDKKIRVTLEPLKRCIIFKDNAKKFNMLTYPDPDITLDVENRPLGGLGIYLTKKYAKSIEYSYENGFNILKVWL